MNQTIQYITSCLSILYPPSEARELALWLAEETTGLSRSQILCKDTLNIPNLETLLQRLLQSEPIQYIFGYAYWRGLKLHVDSSTLIPRPETAELVDWIIDAEGEKEGLSIMDVGTGSGCIAVALKLANSTWAVHACDISTATLNVAKQNAAECDAQVDFQQLDVLHDDLPICDVIVSNPPYITNSEKADMHKNVLDYEPPTALFVPDSDPLLFYRHIARQKAAKTVYFEINQYLSTQTMNLLIELGYKNIQLRQDIEHNPRMIRAEL